MNQNLLLFLLIWPVLAAGVCALVKNERTVSRLGTWLSWPLLFSGVATAVRVFNVGDVSIWNNGLRVDALSAIMVLVIAVVGFAALQFSGPYMAAEVEHGLVKPSRIRAYYAWLYLFLATMILACLVNNLGVMWVAIEATTLASAVLVAFYSKPASLEAAWKYVILCSVGIALALFGIVLAYSSSIRMLGENSGALQWTVLRAHAPYLDPKQLRLAFILILIGFGTKAGLAPMHTWLPDAHSQSPSPVSALLSGVLLSCAVYGLLRFQAICAIVPGIGNTRAYLVAFGLLSILIAVPFIFIQGDIKRLLAYSSVENVGLIALGVGLGGFWAVYGALLHLINHAVSKALLFLAGGSLAQRFGTRRISQIRGALQAFPVTGTLFGLGLLSIGGMPGFGPFLSEFTLLSDGFRSGPLWAVLLGLAGLVTAFSGFIYHGTRMLFGHSSREASGGEKFSAWWSMGLLLLAAVVLGFWIPAGLKGGLESAVYIVTGGRFR